MKESNNESSFMLLHMDLKFQRYVELNFPVCIHVEMNRGKQMLDKKLAYHKANRDKALSLQDYKNKLNLKYGYNL
ncbi:MAG: hypothetical protein H7A23_09415 [Leptospiraceae bacterium]|nr:hypothetical protein [Leptospiraceae bacterium]MCP5494760.1 hypothetical protein [Leptospiraceae bacterium]MCP5494762.1 hypothetical protein [Leptospiraceae bacterium]